MRPLTVRREPAIGARGAHRRTGVRILFLLLTAMGLAGCLERLFFYPDSTTYARPEHYGLRYEDVSIDAVDGSRMHGWWLPATRPALGSVLHLHGNAANVSNHLPLVAWLPDAGFDVLMLDYRGFGRSQGAPTLDGVVDDAAAALQYLRSRPDVDGERLAVLGQSIGGAAALRLLARDSAGVRLAVIEAAFASYRGIARDAAMQSVVLAPLLPLALPALPPSRDDPVNAIASLRVPLLIVHGTDDEVIPFAHGEKLAAAAPPGTVFLRVAGAHHMEPLTRAEVRQRVVQALTAALR